jgi:hypothetical protein
MADETATTRRCIGSERFGIEPHEAPVEDFPKQPSQKDGLGRMCKTHWNAYTARLARDAKARKVGADGGTLVEASVPAARVPAATDAGLAEREPAPKPEPIRTKAPRAARKALGDAARAEA